MIQALLAQATPPKPSYWQALLETLGGWETFSPYISAALVLLVGLAIAKITTRIIRRLERPSISAHALVITEKLVFYVIIVLAVIMALQQVGVKVSNLLAAAGIMTVAISFAAQTSVSNVISGIFLIFDRPFSIGDTIKVDTTLGVVQSIGLLSSKVRTFENLVVRIPNEALLKSTIINYSLVQVRRVDVTVTVSQEANLERVRDLLLQVMREHEQVLDEPAPAVLTDLTTDTGVVLITRVWVLSDQFVQTRSALTTSVLSLLQEHNIPRPRQYWSMASPLAHEVARPTPEPEKEPTTLPSPEEATQTKPPTPAIPPRETTDHE